MNTDGYLGMGIYPNFGLMGIWVWVNTHIFGYTHGYLPMGTTWVHNCLRVRGEVSIMNEGGSPTGSCIPTTP